MIMLTPADFEDKMRELIKERDVENRHEKADALMCEALIDNGYDSGVEIFKNMEKWYS